MFTIKSFVIIAAASVQSGFGLELQVQGKSVNVFQKAKDAFKKFKGDAPSLNPDVQERMEWERSTVSSSLGLGRLTKKLHGGGFALTDEERNVVATMAVFFGLSETGQSSWPQSANPPRKPKEWENKWKKNPFRRVSHCRYSGKVVRRQEINTSIGGVKLSPVIVHKFTTLPIKFLKFFPVTERGQLDIMFKTVTADEDVRVNLSKVLDVDTQCNSPACKVLMKKYINLGGESQDQHITSVPFYRIYTAFQQSGDAEALRTSLNGLNGVYLVSISDLDIDFTDANKKVDEQTTKKASGMNKQIRKVLFGALSHGYIALDCTSKSQQFMKAGFRVARISGWVNLDQNEVNQGGTEFGTSFVQNTFQTLAKVAVMISGILVTAAALTLGFVLFFMVPGGQPFGIALFYLWATMVVGGAGAFVGHQCAQQE